MFRVMRNTKISGTELISSLEEQLRMKLPSSWTIVVEREPRTPRGRPDALVRLSNPEGVESVLLVESKNLVEPRAVSAILDQLRRWPEGQPVVVAPFLSRRAREELIEAGAGYADATGNLRLALERPALFLETTGAASNPWPEERPLRSLKGPTAARVVRALCDLRPPYGVRELAERAGASPASVSRVVELVDREALLTREPRGPISGVDWPRLIRRWTNDYSFTESNRTTTFLEPRGLQALTDKLTNSPLGYAVTGSIAASKVAPVAPARLAAIYVDDVAEIADALGLREAETGANVLLAEPLDLVVFDRTWEAGGTTLAALSQVAADLLTSPGRGPAEADELLRWMEQNEESWRA
jgi:hypothetical protein